jgi:hypothetical protein
LDCGKAATIWWYQEEDIMASDAKFTDQNAPVTNTKTRASSDEEHVRGSNDESSVIDAQTYAYSEDRKIGVTGAVFLILNKMIGTGSTFLSMAPCP